MRLNVLTDEFRKAVALKHSLTHRPVTIWRVGDGEWRIR